MDAVSGWRLAEQPVILPEVAHQRLAEKVTKSTLSSSTRVNWDHTRVVTPGGMCGYRDDRGVKVFSFRGNGSVQLFFSGADSQGLILQGDQVVAASVTSDIQSRTQRKNEKKGTFVQYDKTRVDQDGRDFAVDPANYRGWVNYQGGHLIDHKYSAGRSHYHEKNYIPVHFFYNAPLKEHLVQGCDAYVEIPIYTPNPPRIGVKGNQDNYHEIPVGIIFVQLSNNAIQDVYYFPNNDFNYHGLKTRLNLEKQIAKEMVPYFKLEKCFHQLLRPALITDFDSVAGGTSKQAKRERDFFKTLDDVSFGMSLAECSEDQDILTRFSFSVLHERHVDPFLCLACDEDEFKELEDQPLAPAFNALGEFLVLYGLRNALKSEVISIKSRLVFVNVIGDFIEANTQVCEEVLDFIDSLAPEFKAILSELDKIANTMDLEELIYLVNTYQRLSSVFNHPFSLEGHQIYDDEDFYYYFKKTIEVLEIITSKCAVDSFNEDLAWTFLTCVKETQGVLNYLLEMDFDKEDFEEQGEYLQSIASFCLKLLAKQSSENGMVTAQFQTNIDKIMSIKTSVGYLESIFAKLGIFDTESEE